jgi:hypothetical protein
VRGEPVKIRATVFDSKAEERVFRSLQSRWSSELVMYPSLPLAKLITLEEHDLLPANDRAQAFSWLHGAAWMGGWRWYRAADRCGGCGCDLADVLVGLFLGW